MKEFECSEPTAFAPAERLAPEDLQKQVRDLESLPLIAGILDATSQIVMVLNQERQIVFINDAALPVLGWSQRNDVLGLRPGEALGCIHARNDTGGCGTTEFCRMCGAVQSILEAQAGSRSVRECRILHGKRGDAFDYRVSAVPFDIGGNTFTVFSLTDISDEKRRKVLERFFYHDIMNTAWGLQGYASIINHLHSNDDKIEDLLPSLVKMSDQLVEDICSHRQLLAAESGELSLEFSRLHAMDFLEGIIDRYRHRDVTAERTLLLSDSSDDVMFLSDPVLLRRVLGNMVENALEASEPGDTITLSSRLEEATIVFEVHNPQVMSRDVQLQLFKRSFSTKGEGRGIGTYSMKYMSERYLAGTVMFRSREGEGTTFSAMYPLGGPRANSLSSATET